MDSFLENYKQIFKPVASQNGFKSYKNAFYRVTNDVVQYFLIHRWVPFGRSCTINFDVYPLCIRVDKSYFCSASFDIVQLLDTTKWWEYDPNNEESIFEVLNEMLTATNKYLIPFFEKTTDCTSAYEELCNLEKRIFTGIPGGIIMNDYAKVCYAIKMGSYNKAVEYLKVAEEQNLSIDVQTLENLDPSEKEEYIKRHNVRLNGIRKEIELLSIPDMDYINAFITDNEEYSLRSLGQYKKKK